MGSPRYRNPNVRPHWYRQRSRIITPSQKKAERALWPSYGLSWSHGTPLDLDAAFAGWIPPAQGESATLESATLASLLADRETSTDATPRLATRLTPLGDRPPASPPTRVLEVGCGSGEALLANAEARPHAQFVGVDWFRAGHAVAMQQFGERGLSNVRLVRADAALLLERGLPARPLFNEVMVFFPDPWNGSPEMRLIRTDFLGALAPRLRPGASLHLATDVAGYPEYARRVFREAGGWSEIPAGDAARQRPSTRYFREAIAEGRTSADLLFRYLG